MVAPLGPLIVTVVVSSKGVVPLMVGAATVGVSEPPPVPVPEVPEPLPPVPELEPEPDPLPFEPPEPPVQMSAA